jgi:hypothetical protein
MATLSQYLEDQVLNWLKGSTFAAAPTVYVDLLDSGSSSLLTTLTGSATRPSVTFGAISTDGNGRIMSNSGAVTFTASASAGGVVAYVALYDAATAGNQLSVVASAKTINTADPVEIVIGDLTFKMD